MGGCELNSIVADGLVVYRCYVVWGHSLYIIIIPVICMQYNHPS